MKIIIYLCIIRSCAPRYSMVMSGKEKHQYEQLSYPTWPHLHVIAETLLTTNHQWLGTTKYWGFLSRMRL